MTKFKLTLEGRFFPQLNNKVVNITLDQDINENWTEYLVESLCLRSHQRFMISREVVRDASISQLQELIMIQVEEAAYRVYYQ
jgi:hypothetical protein